MKKRQPSLLSKHARTIAILAVGFSLGFSGGFILSASQHSVQLEDFDLPQEALNLLNQYYFGLLPDSILLQRGMTQGLLEAIEDPYTTYLDPVTHELEEQTLQGAYGGIGAFLTPTSQGWALIPFENGPAAQAGVLDGDILLRVDDTPINASSSEAEVTATLRGSAGTTVVIEVERQAGEILSFEIFRQILPLPSASSYIHPQAPQIGILKLSGFGTPTEAEIWRNLEDLDGKGVKGLILDLRSNPGGLLDSSLAVADIFLSDGIIVTEIAYDGQRTQHTAKTSSNDVTLPLALLVDSGTASAAEVLAAALQSNDRAMIFGQPTFGKGSVQSIYGLSDGSSLHITTSRWFDPAGTALDKTGLVPDFVVELNDGSDDPAMQAAIAYLNRLLEEQS